MPSLYSEIFIMQEELCPIGIKSNFHTGEILKFPDSRYYLYIYYIILLTHILLHTLSLLYLPTTTPPLLYYYSTTLLHYPTFIYYLLFYLLFYFFYYRETLFDYVLLIKIVLIKWGIPFSLTISDIPYRISYNI